MFVNGLSIILDNDSDKLFRSIYDNLYEFIDPSSIPHVVVALG